MTKTRHVIILRSYTGHRERAAADKREKKTMTTRDKAREILDTTTDDGKAFEMLLTWTAATYGLKGDDLMDYTTRQLEDAAAGIE